MLLFPSALPHFILRSNDAMSDVMRDYFRHGLTYLDYLQRRSESPATLAQPMRWVKAWLDGIAPRGPAAERRSAPEREAELAERVEQLEERIRQLENTE